MTYVIAEPCIGVKDGSCVDACPVECIYTGSEVDQYFINPDECIDCGVCAPECPVDAIYPEEEVPDKWSHFIGRNTDFFEDRDDGLSGSRVPLRGPLPTLPGTAHVSLTGQTPMDRDEYQQREAERR